MKVISSAIEKIWKIRKPTIFTEVRRNVYITTFSTKADKQKVMDRRA